MDATASALVDTARRFGWLPSAPDSVSDDDVLGQMTQELRLGMASLLKSVHQGYSVETSHVTVLDGEAYLPKACSSLAVQRVQWLDGGQLHRVEQMQPAAAADYSYAVSWPLGYWLEGSKIFVPGGWSGTLVVTYQALSPDLVATSDAAQVASVTNTTTFVTSSTPSGWASSPTAVTVDIISSRPGAPSLYREVSATRSTNTFTVANTEGILSGDWVALTGQSPLVPLPPELLTLLGLRVAAQIAASSGSANAGALQALLAKHEGEALKLIAPRGTSVAAIVPRYAPGRFRGRGRVW